MLNKHLIKNIIALAPVVALLISILTLWEKLSPPMRILLFLISISFVCIYILKHKTLLSISNRNSQKIYLKIIRILSTLILSGIIFYLIIAWPLLTRKYYFSPKIRKIYPIIPIASLPLEILGDNLPKDLSKLEIYFGNVKVERVISTNDNKIQLIVPSNAISGPLRVVKQNRSFGFLPKLTAYYPVTKVRCIEDEVLLLTEKIKPSKGFLEVDFSLLNTMDDRGITVYDLQFYTLLVISGGVTYKVDRIDLGNFYFYINNINGIKQLIRGSTSLFDREYVIKLEPRRSESFGFKLHQPSTPHNLEIIFTLGCLFYDEKGIKGTAFSDMVYHVLADVIQGFIIKDEIPLNHESLNALKKRYADSIYIPGGLKQ